MEASKETRVWDLWVRISHWSLAVIFVSNRFLNEEGEEWHQRLGYAACILIGLRLIWGFVGSKQARFSEMLKNWPPRGERLSHFQDYLRGRTPRYLNHPPLAQVGMVFLLGNLLLLGLTGWLMGVESFAETEWLEESHELLANSMLVLVIVHVLGVLRESKLHGENLIASMIHGRKRP